MANIELELFSEFGSQNLNLAKADSDVLPVMRERQIFSPCNQFSLDLCQYADYTSTWQMPKVAGETITQPPSEIQAFYRSKRTVGSGVWGHCYTEDRRLLPFQHLIRIRQKRQQPSVLRIRCWKGLMALRWC